ncbi:MAG: response regulator transcription factor [Bacteroidales bacterium]|nr:response regulator transcription factor [Bacteroidales bacterium]
MKRILVVDDEQDLCEILRFNLEAEGFQVTTATSAEEALERGVAGFDLLLLDVMLAGMSGWRMAKVVRSNPQTAGIPVIFLTARDSEDDTIRGFAVGADDYIPKPFSTREVVARIKAVLRRSAETSQHILRHDGLIIDLDRKTVCIDGQDIPFTRTEYELLRILLEHPGKVFSRQELIDQVWPEDVIVLDRTVDVNITRLRKKIGRFASAIVTRSGFGYCFET